MAAARSAHPSNGKRIWPNVEQVELIAGRSRRSRLGGVGGRLWDDLAAGGGVGATVRLSARAPLA